MNNLSLLIVLVFVLSACHTDDKLIDIKSDNFLQVSIKFDPNQERLDNFGNPADIVNGNAAQTPDMKGMSIHFIELIPNQITPYKEGFSLFAGAEVSANNANPYGFNTAINFDEAIVVGEGELFLELPIKKISPGTYKHLRASVSYQEFDVKFNLINILGGQSLMNQNGRIASFLGYNTAIKTVSLAELNLDVNDTKLQGFWAFESDLSAPYQSFNQIYSGEAPGNATTVVNPFSTPIPQGSCVVSGSLDTPVTITGNESEDIKLTLSFSINNSFEWEDKNGNGEWDIDVENESIESVVDMGLRGLKVINE